MLCWLILSTNNEICNHWTLNQLNKQPLYQDCVLRTGLAN